MSPGGGNRSRSSTGRRIHAVESLCLQRQMRPLKLLARLRCMTDQARRRPLASERSPVSSLDLPKRASSPHGKEICSVREGWRVLASGAGGIAASWTKRVSSGMLRTRHAPNLCTKRNELYLHEAGCVHDTTRWWFRVAVVVPDHAANNFIVLVVPRGQAFLPFRRSHLFHPFHLIDILSG